MEDKIKQLFFNETLKRWHFEELVKGAKVSRERANFFLKRLQRDGIITRVKEKGKMPYYLANKENLGFRMEKRLYGLRILQESGLFMHLASLSEVKSSILFGSFSRGDFGRSSDIDLFIYGNDEEFEKGKFESKLKREIHVFSYEDKKEIKKDLDPKVIPNIAQGFYIKRSIEPFEVTIHA